MSSFNSNRRQKPARIIDHEPLAKNDDTIVAFGKRRKAQANPEASKEDAYRPFEKNGISSYFIERVRTQQAETSNNKQGRFDRSAIRQTGTGSSHMDEESGVPYSALAAVFALAIAIPVGFIWYTEQVGSPGIDQITTASLSAGDGLAVQDISMTRILRNGTFVVSISGKIKNTAEESKSLLPLTIALMDKEGNEVQSWRHRAGNGIVKSDGSIFFRTSAIDFSGRAETAHVIAKTVK